ncbi:MAG: metallophosphoesterase family protein [Persicimonas sp.]
MEHLRTTEFDFGAEPTAVRHPPTPDLHKPSDVCRLGHLSDFHFGKPTDDGLPNEEAVERWLDAFEKARVDALAVTGDLVETPGDREGLERAKRLLEAASFRCLVIPGNHDIAHPGKEGPFEELFGPYPRVERAAGAAFLLFDSMGGLPEAERSDRERRDAAERGAFSRGAVGEKQRRRIEEDLGEKPPFGRVVLVHHHLRYNAPTATGWEPDPASPHGFMSPLADARRHLGWAATRARLVLHGHKHNFWEPYRPLRGLVVLNSGTAVQAKPGRRRRGRIVDLAADRDALTIHDLAL